MSDPCNRSMVMGNGWNYRVVRSTHHSQQLGDCYSFSIREVYYGFDGAPKLMTENSVTPLGDTMEELESDLKMQLIAFNLPVLDEDELTKEWACSASS